MVDEYWEDRYNELKEKADNLLTAIKENTEDELVKQRYIADEMYELETTIKKIGDVI